MEAGLKQNKIDARNATSGSFNIRTESLLKTQKQESETK